jgi:hypothetical protein
MNTNLPFAGYDRKCAICKRNILGCLADSIGMGSTVLTSGVFYVVIARWVDELHRNERVVNMINVRVDCS